MANESEDEKNTREYQLSMDIIGGARRAAAKMGVSPGAWVLAVIDELGYMAYTQRDQALPPDAAFDVIVNMLEEAFDNMERNGPKESTTALNVRFVLKSTDLDAHDIPELANEIRAKVVAADTTRNMVDDIIKRAVKK